MFMTIDIPIWGQSSPDFFWPGKMRWWPPSSAFLISSLDTLASSGKDGQKILPAVSYLSVKYDYLMNYHA